MELLPLMGAYDGCWRESGGSGQNVALTTEKSVNDTKQLITWNVTPVQQSACSQRSFTRDFTVRDQWDEKSKNMIPHGSTQSACTEKQEYED